MSRPTRPYPSRHTIYSTIRFKNLFKRTLGAPNTLNVSQKLYNLVETSIKLPETDAGKLSIGSETTADIKTLVAKLLELAEAQSNIPSIQQNQFSDEDEDHKVERALAGVSTFGCKLSDLIGAHLDKLAKDLAEIGDAHDPPI